MAERGPGESVMPQSRPVPAAIPALLARLIDVAAASPRGAPLDQTLERLLDLLVELEVGAAAGVRLDHPEPLVVWRTRSARIGSPRQERERLFPQLAQEIVVALPGEDVEGALHFAVDDFARISRESLELGLHQTAAVVALTVRAVREADLEARPNTDRPIDSTRDPLSRAEIEQLQQLEKLATLGQTASQIVHEMNNPLTAIIAYTDFLARRFEGRGDAREIDRVHRIQEAADRLQRFARELTDYSRPEQGMRGPVDLHAVIDRALGFCIHGLRSSNVTVERVYRDIPAVRGLESSLTQVFVNLITNAGHAMETQAGTVRIETRADAEKVVVEVHDEGHGIDPAHLGKIFETYFTTKPKGHGVGLGLSIVRKIVAAHGGRIYARNRASGGCTFYVELPLVTP